MWVWPNNYRACRRVWSEWAWSVPNFSPGRLATMLTYTLSIRYSVNSTNILYMHMDIMGIAKST